MVNRKLIPRKWSVTRDTVYLLCYGVNSPFPSPPLLFPPLPSCPPLLPSPLFLLLTGACLLKGDSMKVYEISKMGPICREGANL